MRKFIIGLVAATIAMPVLPSAAIAQRRDRDRDYDGRSWQGRDGRTYCKKSNGTTGLLIGGAAGALAGRAIDTRGERTTGTVVGAAAGALLGRKVERDRSTRRCR